jgi:hypothetical protein
VTYFSFKKRIHAPDIMLVQTLPYSPHLHLFIHYDEVTAAFTRVMMGGRFIYLATKKQKESFNNNWTWLLLLPFAGQHITGHKFQPH